eukprot:TRINITY_DN20939_c0_g2_i1.p1 TRINITY_DN20939_c0_g2~~TRINITY_DN20939_c0_g2_i1.p1  ORF type:complete len:334 (-),score=56.52 TRINITY_DN20939_c0_g2_i1:113-1114(-)
MKSILILIVHKRRNKKNQLNSLNMHKNSDSSLNFGVSQVDKESLNNNQSDKFIDGNSSQGFDDKKGSEKQGILNDENQEIQLNSQENLNTIYQKQSQQSEQNLYKDQLSKNDANLETSYEESDDENEEEEEADDEDDVENSDEELEFIDEEDLGKIEEQQFVNAGLKSWSNKHNHQKKHMRGFSLIEANDAKFLALKYELKRALLKQTYHQLKMHPEKDFPIDKIEHCVREVKNNNKKVLSSRNKQLFYFGDTQIFASDAMVEKIQKEYQRDLGLNGVFQKVDPPMPPVSGWNPLQKTRIARQLLREHNGKLILHKQCPKKQVVKQVRNFCLI